MGSVEQIVLPAPFPALLDAHGTINDYESSRALAHERRHFPHLLSPLLRSKLEQGDRRTFDEYVAAQQVAADCRRALRDVFAAFDVLLVPSAPGEAPLGLASTGDSIFNRLWSASYGPALTLPVATGPAGLPLGVQFVGEFGADHKLLAAAARIARALQ